MRYETQRTGRPGHPDSGTDTLARGLGVFSIVLGAMEIFATRALTKALGMKGHETLMRVYGAREIASGIGILTSKDPTPWVWSRVAGDAIDIATLAPYLDESNRKRENVWMALAAVLGATAADFYCALTLSRETKVPQPPVRDYTGRTGMPRSPEEMRGAARDFEVPADMRTPEALRPYPQGQRSSAQRSR